MVFELSILHLSYSKYFLTFKNHFEFYHFSFDDYSIWFRFMSGSCHLDTASNVKSRIQCQIFVIVIFFNCSWVLQFGAHSRYYEGASTQKRSFQVICTTFRSAFSCWLKKSKQTFKTKFDAMSKWHEPDIILWFFFFWEMCFNEFLSSFFQS